MKRHLIAKLILAACLALPWLAISSGCAVRFERGSYGPGWYRSSWYGGHRDWDDRGFRRSYDRDFHRDRGAYRFHEDRH